MIGKAKKSTFFFLSFLFIAITSLKAQLVINEISQGPSGAKEYVEFLVVGTPSCSSIPCIDLRGYYIDDNNGTQATGTGTGIAQGCIRFKSTSFWSCIPAGTLIVVYNDDDANSSMPANDLSMTDGNCKLVIPVSNCTLLEMNTDSPSLSSASFPTSGFNACGDWTSLAMANGDDSFQTVDASGNTVFSVSWGNNTESQVIYFSGTSTATVAYMTNAVNNIPSNQANWTRVSTTGNETPGAPNNAANAAWISSMNNSCNPITPLSLATNPTNPGCTCDGSITVTASGGTGPYTYSWAPSGGSTATASGLCAGTYTVTVTAAGGCSQTATATLTANNTSIAINVNDVTVCSGQSATLTATGADSYVWSTGATTASISDSPSSTETYTVTGTSNGCTGTSTGTITIAGTLNVSVNSVTTCAGQSATLTATGATSYVWSTGATTASIAESPSSTETYTVTGTSNGCTGTATGTITIAGALNVSVNSVTTCAGQSASLTATGATNYVWSTGATTASISDSPSSTETYTVTGTSNGCTGTATGTITIAGALNISVNSVTTCAGQSATLTATGATNYVWSTGATTASIAESPSSTETYTVTGTSNGCTGTSTGTITIASALSVSVNSITTCAGQSATLTATGATDYLWSTGATTSSITESPLSTETFTVTGTSNGCTGTATGTITIAGTLNVSVNSVTTCAGQSATLIATGATDYLWSTGATTASISESPLSTETYTVTGTSNGCSGIATGTITIGGALTVSVNSVTTCAGQSATLIATGATDYLWSTGATTASISESPLSTETYTVTGTSNGCSGTATGTITIGGTLTVSVNSVTTCAGQSATLIATGATDYLWSTGATTASISESPLSTETYTVTGTSNGCSGIATGTITIGAELVVSVNSVTVCAGQNAVLTATGADDYSWSTGALTNTITESPLVTTSYTVTGTSNGCSGTAIGTVQVNELPSVLFNADVVSGCEAFCSNFTDASTGNISTWNWDFGDGQSSDVQHPQYCFQVQGTYSVSLTVTSADGCSASFTNANMINLSAGAVADFEVPLPLTIIEPSVSFTDKSAGAESWSWNFGDSVYSQDNTSTLKNPEHTYSEAGSYCASLIVNNSSGCADTAVHCFDIEPYFTFYIPNTFSPNNDGKNDEFFGVGENVLEYEMAIYDRWGKIVFITQSQAEHWNGRIQKSNGKCMQDSYVYLITVKDVNKNMHQYSGTVTLLKE